LSDEMLTEISYVKISSYRKRVMKSLEDDVKMPSEIAKDAEIRQNHISKVLSELKARDLVECINPEVRKGRLYRHTDKGVDVVKNLEFGVEVNE
ncbi:MAG: transcriptional regulator, partial [Methanobrevibacter sp.]|nr:transcriptional regulator [Methanobrevibacter sp.]